jgi:formate/nitrite transporter FocA (FNT family)
MAAKAEQAGVTKAALPLRRLVPLGNIVGGAVFVGLVCRFVYLRGLAA